MAFLFRVSRTWAAAPVSACNLSRSLAGVWAPQTGTTYAITLSDRAVRILRARGGVCPARFLDPSQQVVTTTDQRSLMKTLRVPSCVASFVIAVLLLLPISSAVADGSSKKGGHDPIEVIFTKWVTTAETTGVLNMEGVVSGDVGGGKFVGEATITFSDSNTTKIDAFYHINGGAHHFTAHNRVTQDNLTGTARIKGVITDGWLKGAKVHGEYQVIAPCGIINAQLGVAGDVCFQGILEIGEESDD